VPRFENDAIIDYTYCTLCGNILTCKVELCESIKFTTPKVIKKKIKKNKEVVKETVLKTPVGVITNVMDPIINDLIEKELMGLDETEDSISGIPDIKKDPELKNFSGYSDSHITFFRK
jgi:hypothetical protein